MLVFPSGSDVNVTHRPWATLGLAVLCVVVTVCVWVRWPKAMLDGEIYIIHADEIREWEAFEQRVNSDPVGAEHAIAAEHLPAAEQAWNAEMKRDFRSFLRHSVGLDGGAVEARSPEEKNGLRTTVAKSQADGRSPPRTRRKSCKRSTTCRRSASRIG